MGASPGHAYDADTLNQRALDGEQAHGCVLVVSDVQPPFGPAPELAIAVLEHLAGHAHRLGAGPFHPL